MKVGDSVRLAIDDWERGESEASVMHACNAVDGTASKRYPQMKHANKQRFTTLLRESYSVFGPTALPHIDLVNTRWPVKLASKPMASGTGPDFADVVYGIHRCTHGHGDELPDGFELIRDAASAGITRFEGTRGTLKLSDRLIFGLLWVAVLAPENVDQRVPETYYLTLETQRFLINEWWGRYLEFEPIAVAKSTLQVKMDFTDWMDVVT
jgi:hypothetical protein